MEEQKKAHERECCEEVLRIVSEIRQQVNG